ncbi:TRAF3-interacting protein 1-like [Iris pallida]|uniref:TRAF3-interacting protein 1-like n=1 Tax=Iris pallida TaxID=29817 RepID=A0AAX6FH66_IRIPA|nr:TRAF3-interacting protein 1-like [Iris pallida]
MSRCFPFPPPGYEKEARSGDNNQDLHRKEKRKEKKHKKEKDKEKREKKDKDRSKDEHKEKKERKEKHTDKTKDKDRDKDKSRTPKGTRTEIRPESHHENQFGYNCKAEEVQDPKFKEELGRRIRDEERGAADRIVGNFITTTQRSLDGVCTSTAIEKESGNKLVPDLSGRRNENLTRPIQKKTEGLGTCFATEKHRAASSEKVPDFTSPEPGRNHITGRQSVNITGASQSKTEATFTAISLQKEKCGSNNLANSLQKERVGSNGITGQLVNNFMGSGQRRTESMLTANSMQKERSGSNNLPGRPLENVISSVQRSTFTGNSPQKERGASNNMVSNFAGAAPKKTDGRGQPPQNLPSSIHRSPKSIGLTSKMEKERVKDSERGASNDMVSDFVGAAQRKNGRMGQQAGNLTPSIQRSAEGIVVAPKMEKEVVKDSGMVPNAILTEQKTNDWIGQPVEKFSEKKKERKEKSKEKKSKEGKGERHKNRDRNEKKSKRKDEDRHKEKEKEEKKRGESDDKHKEHDKLEEIRKNKQLDNITKSVAPQAENANTIAADGNIKKRKEIQINGFLHETDGRPKKLPRTSPSSSRTTLDNGKILESSHIPLPCSIKLDAIDKTIAELSDNKESVLNGKAGGHTSSVASRPPVVIASGESSKVSSKTLSRPPHPDTKFLSTVYSVPKMDELHEFDDQEWLFSSTNQKPSTKLEDEVLPQVWANGLQIESADVFALPYVIPF